MKVCVTHKHIIQKNRWFSTHLPYFLFAFLFLKKIFLYGNSFSIWFSSYYFWDIAKKEKEDWIRRTEKNNWKMMQDRLCFEKNIKKKNISSMHEYMMLWVRPAAGTLCRNAEFVLTYTYMNQVRWEEQHAKMEENDKAPSQINRLFIYY